MSHAAPMPWTQDAARLLRASDAFSSALTDAAADAVAATLRAPADCDDGSTAHVRLPAACLPSITAAAEALVQYHELELAFQRVVGACIAGSVDRHEVEAAGRDGEPAWWQPFARTLAASMRDEAAYVGDAASDESHDAEVSAILSAASDVSGCAGRLDTSTSLPSADAPRVPAPSTATSLQVAERGDRRAVREPADGAGVAGAPVTSAPPPPSPLITDAPAQPAAPVRTQSATPPGERTPSTGSTRAQDLDASLTCLSASGRLDDGSLGRYYTRHMALAAKALQRFTPSEQSVLMASSFAHPLTA